MQNDECHIDPTSRHRDWRVTNWSSAVCIACGGRGLLLLRGAFFVLLAPSIALAAYSLYSNRLSLLFLVLLSCWGFWTSSTGPTGVGFLSSIFVTITTFSLGSIWHDRLFAYSSILPGVTWFGSCAILGTASSYLTEALQKSESTFKTLRTRGILIAIECAEHEYDRTDSR